MAVSAALDTETVREMLDWEIVPEDWWKTSFRAVSWSYKTKPGYPRPPHYHNLLARGRRRRITADVPVEEEDVDLNNGLSGVRAAEESLKRYEVEVSILSPDDLAGQDSDAHRCLTALAKENWDEKVQELLGGILEQGALPEVDEPSPDVPLWDLTRLDAHSPPPGSPSTSGTTDSETSVDSELPPSTPRPSKASYARVVSSETNTSPTVLSPLPSPLPSKLLSAAALTFIPSTPNGPSVREPVTPPLTAASHSSGDSPFSSPTYNFHFPSLKSASPADRRESRSLPPSLQKDESGFYVEVTEDAPHGATQSLNATRSTTPRRPSAAFLPAFLTDGSPSLRPRNSKTREIVDRLRSSGSSSSNRKAKKAERTRRQAVAKDGEVVPTQTSENKPASNTNTKTDDANDGWITGPVSEDISARTIVTDDGWIIQSNTRSQQQQQQQPHQSEQRPKGKHGHAHKRSSGSVSNGTTQSSAAFPPTSQGSTHAASHPPARGGAPVPALPQLYPGAGGMPYPAAPYGAPYAAGSFIPMQYPMQARGPQWTMGFQPGMYPVYQPFGVMPSAPYGMVPVPPLAPAPAFFDGKSKAGSTLVQ
ncbi:hypothetical protein C8Q77DRAFT_1076148 [Trametes polyzona]|nr:hypothetical protein C8Q77DRAFT_1076148 [Trametes polyzona]